MLHLITRLTLGGSAENTVATVETLDSAGYDCTLATSLAESDAAVVAGAGARGCRLVDVRALGREVGPRDLAAVARTLALVRRARPHIVHTHTSKAGFVGRLAARLARVPAVIHQPHGHIFYGYYGRRRTAFYVALERLAARWTDHIVTLTERGTEEHLARGIGRRAQYVAIPSGVPTAELRRRAPRREDARRALGLADDEVAIVALGRFVPVKGFDLLVEALPAVLRRVPRVRLVLVGEGPERPAYEARAGALGVADRLTLTGATEDVVPYLAAGDILAAPSRNEGMGRALVEGMALGLPVVAAAVGGIPSVVDAACGRLMPPGDVGSLAAALADVADDARQRARLGAAARARAETFSAEVAGRAWVALYSALARAKGLA